MEIDRNYKNLPILLAMALVLGAGSAMAEEQRCTELGASCQCSETLDVNSFTWDGVDNPEQQNADSINPSDPNPKQCNGGNAIEVFSRYIPNMPNLVMAQETGMPAGNSVDYVWRWNLGWGWILGKGNYTLQPSTKRVCIRHYLRMSPDYDGGDIATDPTSPNCDAGKFTQFKFNNTYDLQMGSGGSRGRNKNFRYGAPSWGGTYKEGPISGALNYADCYGEWCRVEVCASGDFTSGTGDFHTEGYVERLRDRKRVDYVRFNLGPGNPGRALGFIWIVNGFRGEPTDPGTCGNGYPRDAVGAWREISHLAQAEWTTDVPGTYIGPAYEVEGGSGTTPPPLPAPSPTPPPDSPTPPPETGSLVLVTNGVIAGNAATVTSSVTNGVGPYQFLFDCGRVGTWHGIIDTSSPTAQYTCPLNGQPSMEVRAWVWDRTTNVVRDQIVQVGSGSGAPLGKPGTPTLTNP